MNSNPDLRVTAGSVAQRFSAAKGYLTIRDGLITGGFLAKGGHLEKILMKYMARWCPHWVREGGKNQCHGCPNPLSVGNNRGGTETTFGMRNILYAVALMHSEGEGGMCPLSNPTMYPQPNPHFVSLDSEPQAVD